MSLLPILRYPDKRLKLVADPINDINSEITQLAEDMLETMYEANGVGLAATQVNVQKRIIVMDCSTNRDKATVLINPEITNSIGDITWEEGCLSFPGVYAKVKRKQKVWVKFSDLAGEEQNLEAEELLGVCVQHEIDHLNGITFYDHLSPLKKELLKKKLQKLQDKAL